MADSPDYEHWIEMAERDLELARLVFERDPDRFGTAALFHCQQSAEKYLKACLRFRNMDFPKVHDFERLLRLCERLSPSFRDLGPATARLQPFAVQARYTLRSAERETVVQALEDAATVREHCRRFMSLDSSSQ